MICAYIYIVYYRALYFYHMYIVFKNNKEKGIIFYLFSAFTHKCVFPLISNGTFQDSSRLQVMSAPFSLPGGASMRSSQPRSVAMPSVTWNQWNQDSSGCKIRMGPRRAWIELDSIWAKTIFGWVSNCHNSGGT